MKRARACFVRHDRDARQVVGEGTAVFTLLRIFRVDGCALGNCSAAGVLEEVEDGEKSACLILGDEGVLDDTKVLVAIGLDDDHITFDNREAGVWSR